MDYLQQWLDEERVERKKMEDIVKKRCEELDKYQKDMDLDEMFDLSNSVNLSDSNIDRTILNENVYKEIFFLLNKFLNNDSSYDDYIDNFK